MSSEPAPDSVSPPPGFAGALWLYRAGRMEEAAAACEAAVAAAPGETGPLRLLGDIRHSQGRTAEAAAAYGRALEIDPSLQPAWYGAGCAWLSAGEFALAAAALERAAMLAPAHAPSLHNLGKALFKLGLADEALACLRASLEAESSFQSRSAIATLIPGCPSAGNADVLAARREWAARHLPPPPPPPPRAPRAGRRLRIGYLSSFFQARNWMKPVWALLDHHDRQGFEIHLFSDGPAPEEGAPWLRAGDAFHDISALSNAEAARTIAACALDVLVDLNGFSDVLRLAVPAQKPAPVIAGWFNFYATSGMACYDYLIGDEHVIPPEEEVYYSEKIVRLPGCYLAFDVRYPVPDVAAPPAAQSGSFTFGCLASQYKLTPPVIAAWSRILARSPGSRLLLKNGALGRPANRAHLLARFAQHGIGAERILLEGPAEHFDFLAAYGRVDLALDTFPYNGGTTTSEALWQGVPVLAFPGDRWAARQSASILRNAGLEEFLARDLEGYVERAVALALDPGTPGRLASLRRQMRARLARSPLCDTAALARGLEQRYREFAASGPL